MGLESGSWKLAQSGTEGLPMADCRLMICTRPLLTNRQSTIENRQWRSLEPRTPMLLGMVQSRKSEVWRPQIFQINPTKLLKIQVRCPESDKTIPISDTPRSRAGQPGPDGEKGKPGKGNNGQEPLSPIPPFAHFPCPRAPRHRAIR